MPSVEVTAAATPILGRLATRTINEVRDQSPDQRRHAEAAEDYRVGNHSRSSQDATTWIVRRPAGPYFVAGAGFAGFHSHVQRGIYSERDNAR